MNPTLSNGSNEDWTANASTNGYGTRAWCARARRRPRWPASGHVRLNGRASTPPSQRGAAGRRLTVALDRTVRVLKVAGFADRRGEAEAARALAGSLAAAPAAHRAPCLGQREAGAGRPTKRERRALDRLRATIDERAAAASAKLAPVQLAVARAVIRGVG